MRVTWVTLVVALGACGAGAGADVVTIATPPDDVLERQVAAAAAQAADVACELGPVIEHHAALLRGPHCGNADMDQDERIAARERCDAAAGECAGAPTDVRGCAAATQACIAIARDVAPEAVAASTSAPACVRAAATAATAAPATTLQDHLARAKAKLAAAQAALARLDR